MREKDHTPTLSFGKVIHKYDISICLGENIPDQGNLQSLRRSNVSVPTATNWRQVEEPNEPRKATALK